MAAMIPLITSLTPKALVTPSVAPTTPPRPATLVPPPVPMSPIPSPSAELHTCLSDFGRVKGQDLSPVVEAALLELDLTPDIIPLVPVARLCE
ncbi:hypothetical protein DXG01_014929, partial [Tephrocybe rancida]